MARNPVDDLIVHRNAHAGRIALVVQEGGHGALRLDETVYCFVNFMGCYAGGYHFSCQSTSCRGNFPRPAHQFDLVAGFEGDHSAIPKTARIAWAVSSFVPFTATLLSRPRWA